jgi:predicted GNAT family acetyltransferase
MPDETLRITNNEEKSRYEIVIGDQVAFLDYRRRGDSIVLLHTEVPVALRERGLGRRLAKHALDQARRDGLGVIVKCPFITTWLKRHREYDDIVVARVHDTGEIERYQPPEGPR